MERSPTQAGVTRRLRAVARPDAGAVAKRGEQRLRGGYVPPADRPAHRPAQPQPAHPLSDCDPGTHLGAGTHPVVGRAIRGVHLAARLVAQGAAGVVRWLRAGQVAGDGSVELARWTGARR